MRYTQKKTRRNRLRLVSGLAAAAVCFLLVMSPMALAVEETTETTAPETTGTVPETQAATEATGTVPETQAATEATVAEVPVTTETIPVETKAGEESEGVIPETAATEEPTAPPVVITEEMIQEAWERFSISRAPVDPDLEDPFAGINPGSEYYRREDVLEAIDTCAMALEAESSLKEQIEDLVEKIGKAEALAEADRQEYIDAFAGELDALPYDPEFEVIPYDPELELLALLKEAAMPEDADEVLEMAGIDRYMENMAKLEAAAMDFSEILDLWEEIHRELTLVNSYVTPAEDSAEEATQNVQDAVALRTADFNQRFAQQKSAGKKTFIETEPVLKTIKEQARQLEKDIRMLPVLVEMEQGTMLEKLARKLDDVSKQLETVAGKAVYAYLALGLAGFGILMSIVAAVFAMRKPKEEKEPEETPLMASRADVEALERQNHHLRNQLELLEQKLDGVNDAVQGLKERRSAEPGPAEIGKKPVEQPVVPEVQAVKQPAEPEKPKPLGSPNRVCCLELVYLVNNPGSSYLKRNEQGDYVLFDDNTLELRNSRLGCANEMADWKNDGTLYLFNAQIGERTVNAEVDELPGSYCEAVRMISRAKVERRELGNYGLLEKGCVLMKEHKKH